MHRWNHKYFVLSYGVETKRLAYSSFGTIKEIARERLTEYLGSVVAQLF
ncbi:hypothetical protein GCM10025794_37150 [Massilia kyonggiensis]|jgi:hypothetical protein